MGMRAFLWYFSCRTVTSYRLRYQATDLEVQVGEFVIGRSSSCNLALDDALVSRRHAVLHVTKDTAELEDLGSRNGVTVNGTRVEGRQVLRHLDRIMIGGHEIVLIALSERYSSNPPTGVMQLGCAACGASVQIDETFCRQCGVPLSNTSRTLAGATIELNRPTLLGKGGSDGEDDTRAANAFTLLAGIAHKALSLGRFDEAERLLSGHLDLLLKRTIEGDAVADDVVRDATRYALKLARGTGKGRWLDWVFRVHNARAVMLTPVIIDELHELVRQLKYGQPKYLREYLTTLRAQIADLSPTDRFLLKRLEGLDGVISA